MTPNGSGSGELQSEINVTPLVDVVLVLLIIFMVIVPLTLHGYDVDVPGPAVIGPPDEPRPRQIVLSIDVAGCPVLQPPAGRGLPSECRVRLDDRLVAVEELAPRVQELLAEHEPQDRVLFLAADDRLSYEAVLRIVDLARSGVEGLRIGLVTQRPRSAPRS